jgi:hypothetical protein
MIIVYYQSCEFKTAWRDKNRGFDALYWVEFHIGTEPICWISTSYVLKCKRCTQDVKTLVYPLQTDRGRRLNLPWDFNYSFHFLNIIHFIFSLYRWPSSSCSNIREFKIYDATGSTTRLRKKEICHARQKLWINLWSQGYSQRVCHAQQNVKLSIITSFKQREAYCDPKGDT